MWSHLGFTISDLHKANGLEGIALSIPPPASGVVEPEARWTLARQPPDKDARTIPPRRGGGCGGVHERPFSDAHAGAD
jgi:hypothetical protein